MFAAALTVQTVVMPLAIAALNIGVGPCWGEAFGDMLEAMAVKSIQVNTLPKAKSKTRSKQNKGMHKFSSLYSERGVLLPE